MLSTNGNTKHWSPSNEVTPQHWGAAADAAADEPTDDFVAIRLADRWAAKQRRPLVGRGQYAIGSRLNLRSERAELRLKLLDALRVGNVDSGLPPQGNYAVTVGSFFAQGAAHRYRFIIDGSNIHGKIRKGWDASSGKFPTEYYTGEADSGDETKPPFQVDQWYTILEPRDTNFTDIGAEVSAQGVLFKATVPGSGSGTAILRKREKVEPDDVFIVTLAGTVDGQDFNVGDRLRALITNPSDIFYAGSWEKVNPLIACRVSGLANPLNDINVQGVNCDVLVKVFGNSERLNVFASGDACGCVLWETQDGSSTPDSNTYSIRGSQCVQWYKADGALVSAVDFNTQNSLNTSFDVPCVEDRGPRVRQYSGIMRTNHSSVLMTGVDVFVPDVADPVRKMPNLMFDLCLEGAMRTRSQIGGGDQPVLHIAEAQNLSGNLLSAYRSMAPASTKSPGARWHLS
ncbi:hypothetical protein [Tateyamaria sp. ANG-S1]|uniref:hypothetical protein n=1 Tax=Tateyamaria sp. ANG-S1 TaxID=1577905 RepID=UPI0006906B84|nr:hypothetical protein [Tateyamaria sp. ANG-S1]